MAMGLVCYNPSMVKVSKSVRIVLVKPRNPLNIAAAARAAQNFGFDDLVVVAPYGPVWEEAQTTAGAGKWLRQARAVSHLTEAIADRNWVLGTSSLARRHPTEPQRVLSLEGLAAYSKRQKGRDRIAILFGSEKRGLTNEDLSYCHAILRIPTSAKATSMNLGQAVAVCCYELRQLLDGSRARKTSRNSAAASCAQVGEIIRLIDELHPLLGESEASHSGKLRKRKERLRQILMRWSITSQDLTLLFGLVRDLSRKVRNQ